MWKDIACQIVERYYLQLLARRLLSTPGSSHPEKKKKENVTIQYTLKFTEFELPFLRNLFEQKCVPCSEMLQTPPAIICKKKKKKKIYCFDEIVLERDQYIYSIFGTTFDSTFDLCNYHQILCHCICVFLDKM